MLSLPPSCAISYAVQASRAVMPRARAGGAWGGGAGGGFCIAAPEGLLFACAAWRLC